MKTFITIYPILSALLLIGIIAGLVALYRRYQARNTQDAGANERTNLGVTNASQLHSSNSSLSNFSAGFTGPTGDGAGAGMRMSPVKGY